MALSRLRTIAPLVATGLALVAGVLPAAAADPAADPTIAAPSAYHAHVFPDTVTQLASTVPANGDVNPYGVAVVPTTTGDLRRGDVLVSNFNASSNLQGTGTTIVQVAPNGATTTFATIDPTTLPGTCPGGVGLTTALSVLRSGWVIVGSLPTADGSAATAQAGCLIVLDDQGQVRETFAGDGINGPWDMTALDRGDWADLFVTNVLNGTVAANGATVNEGTVLRITLSLKPGRLPRRVDTTVIGSSFPEHTDPAALVVGPTGVSLGENGTLYVADSVDNRIAAIPHAVYRHTSDGTGTTVTSGGALNTPLGLTVDDKGLILTVNAGDGNLVYTTPGGTQVHVTTLDSSGTPPGAGALFGLATKPHTDDVYFVDDATNTLNLLH